jgi:hypothetical protein
LTFEIEDKRGVPKKEEKKKKRKRKRDLDDYVMPQDDDVRYEHVRGTGQRRSGSSSAIKHSGEKAETTLPFPRGVGFFHVVFLIIFLFGILRIWPGCCRALMKRRLSKDRDLYKILILFFSVLW